MQYFVRCLLASQLYGQIRPGVAQDVLINTVLPESDLTDNFSVEDAPVNGVYEADDFCLGPYGNAVVDPRGMVTYPSNYMKSVSATVSLTGSTVRARFRFTSLTAESEAVCRSAPGAGFQANIDVGGVGSMAVLRQGQALTFGTFPDAVSEQPGFAAGTLLSLANVTKIDATRVRVDFSLINPAVDSAPSSSGDIQLIFTLASWGQETMSLAHTSGWQDLQGHLNGSFEARVHVLQTGTATAPASMPYSTLVEVHIRQTVPAPLDILCVQILRAARGTNTIPKTTWTPNAQCTGSGSLLSYLTAVTIQAGQVNSFTLQAIKGTALSSTAFTMYARKPYELTDGFSATFPSFNLHNQYDFVGGLSYSPDVGVVVNARLTGRSAVQTKTIGPLRPCSPPYQGGTAHWRNGGDEGSAATAMPVPDMGFIISYLPSTRMPSCDEAPPDVTLPGSNTTMPFTPARNAFTKNITPTKTHWFYHDGTPAGSAPDSLNDHGDRPLVPQDGLKVREGFGKLNVSGESQVELRTSGNRTTCLARPVFALIILSFILLALVVWRPTVFGLPMRLRRWLGGALALYAAILTPGIYNVVNGFDPGNGWACTALFCGYWSCKYCDADSPTTCTASGCSDACGCNMFNCGCCYNPNKKGWNYVTHSAVSQGRCSASPQGCKTSSSMWAVWAENTSTDGGAHTCGQRNSRHIGFKDLTDCCESGDMCGQQWGTAPLCIEGNTIENGQPSNNPIGHNGDSRNKCKRCGLGSKCGEQTWVGFGTSSNASNYKDKVNASCCMEPDQVQCPIASRDNPPSVALKHGQAAGCRLFNTCPQGHSCCSADNTAESYVKGACVKSGYACCRKATANAAAQQCPTATHNCCPAPTGSGNGCCHKTKQITCGAAGKCSGCCTPTLRQYCDGGCKTAPADDLLIIAYRSPDAVGVRTLIFYVDRFPSSSGGVGVPYLVGNAITVANPLTTQWATCQFHSALLQAPTPVNPGVSLPVYQSAAVPAEGVACRAYNGVSLLSTGLPTHLLMSTEVTVSESTAQVLGASGGPDSILRVKLFAQIPTWSLEDYYRQPASLWTRELTLQISKLEIDDSRSFPAGDGDSVSMLMPGKTSMMNLAYEHLLGSGNITEIKACAVAGGIVDVAVLTSSTRLTVFSISGIVNGSVPVTRYSVSNMSLASPSGAVFTGPVTCVAPVAVSSASRGFIVGTGSASAPDCQPALVVPTSGNWAVKGLGAKAPDRCLSSGLAYSNTVATRATYVSMSTSQAFAWPVTLSGSSIAFGALSSSAYPADVQATVNKALQNDGGFGRDVATVAFETISTRSHLALRCDISRTSSCTAPTLVFQLWPQSSPFASLTATSLGSGPAVVALVGQPPTATSSFLMDSSTAPLALQGPAPAFQPRIVQFGTFPTWAATTGKVGPPWPFVSSAFHDWSGTSLKPTDIKSTTMGVGFGQWRDGVGNLLGVQPVTLFPRNDPSSSLPSFLNRLLFRQQTANGGPGPLEGKLFWPFQDVGHNLSWTTGATSSDYVLYCRSDTGRWAIRLRSQLATGPDVSGVSSTAGILPCQHMPPLVNWNNSVTVFRSGPFAALTAKYHATASRVFVSATGQSTVELREGVGVVVHPTPGRVAVQMTRGTETYMAYV